MQRPLGGQPVGRYRFGGRVTFIWPDRFNAMLLYPGLQDGVAQLEDARTETGSSWVTGVSNSNPDDCEIENYG